MKRQTSYFPDHLKGHLQKRATSNKESAIKTIMFIQLRTRNINRSKTHLRRSKLHAPLGRTPSPSLAFRAILPLTNPVRLTTPFPSSTDTLFSCCSPVANELSATANKPSVVNNIVSTRPPTPHAVDTKERPFFNTRGLHQREALDLLATAVAFPASAGQLRGVSWHLRNTNPVGLGLRFAKSSVLPTREVRVTRDAVST